MPKVGSKHFSYDKSGYDKAKVEAERTGLPIEQEDKNYAQFYAGGAVEGKSTKGYRAARKPGKK